MQSPERRRLGGSRREWFARGFTPQLFVHHAAKLWCNGKCVLHSRSDEVSRRDGGGPSASFRLIHPLSGTKTFGKL